MSLDTTMTREYERKIEELNQDFKILAPIQFLAQMVYEDKMNYYKSMISNLREGTWHQQR